MDITLDDRLSAFQQISQRKFVEILDAIPGTKDFIIEDKLMKILDSFVGVSVLRKYGVDKLFKFTQGLRPTNSQRIYVLSCDLVVCQHAFDQIRSEILQTSGLSHHLLIAPSIPIALDNLLEENGLYGQVTMRPLSWELIRIDGNVLSLEIPMFTDLFYHKDTSLLPALAKSLWTLRMILGAPNFSLALGKHSQQILKMIPAIDESLSSPSPKEKIGALIIMDRNKDFVSTLLKPVTYLGLIGEVMEINIGLVTFEKSKVALDPVKDQVYSEVRDKHFCEAFDLLRKKAKALKSEQENINLQSMKVSEMGHYIKTTLKKTTKTKQELEFHLCACEAAINAFSLNFDVLQSVETSSLQDDNPYQSLKLLSLLSITSDGVTNNEIQSLQKAHLHAHGYQNIPLFYKMEIAGLLAMKSENIMRLPNWMSKWTANAKRLKLLPLKNVDVKGPTCSSYVFNGSYIPVIAQVLSIVVTRATDPKNFEELTNTVGCVFSGNQGPINPQTVVVCVVGGITYSEICACRLIEKLAGIRLVLVSDCILTGTKMIESLKNA
ncbi:vacuolar protein sorting-associated protein 33B isoform X2 [Phymastichus coffea]|uniref:vacuolar protein sorting-associated protein 33B isoform X2 n=1 Tax=Phymastichus coffea TaxID=108790 RepID=UPI00273A87B0|nr:vacuolar protein sorting-associated protein 33B isoform X2 [Phymastichus coffea]